MFFRWVKGTNKATISEKMSSGRVAGPVIQITATGKTREAMIELFLEFAQEEVSPENIRNLS